jgi:hypothetical protein
MTLYYRKHDISTDYKPGIDPVPYYSEGTYGIHCGRCGCDFIGIHVCQVNAR